MPQHFGLLNINKPPGVTSRWVVDQVKRIVRPTKVGHAGTLDPLATGVLVVCLGPATRLVEYVQQMPKQYRAEFLLGQTSPTEDIDGDVTEIENPPVPTLHEIEAAAASLTGEIQQRPPAFSALKVSGRRAYDLARRGQTVELAPRPVTIHELTVVGYDYPKLLLNVHCSSGTYVRSLGRDLAEALGTGAIMSALVRTAIGKFCVENAIAVDSIRRETLAEHLLSPRTAVEHLPKLALTADQLRRIACGQFIAPPELSAEMQFNQPIANGDSREFAALDESANLAAILHRRPDGLLGPHLNFVST